MSVSFLGVATTEFHHDSETSTDVTACQSDACFKREITYEAPTEQMIALIDISQSCRQEIRVIKITIVAICVYRIITFPKV